MQYRQSNTLPIRAQNQKIIGWRFLRLLHFCTFFLIGSGCVSAGPDTGYLPKGSYGVKSHCPQTEVPDVDIITIRGHYISDIESNCQINQVRQQADGIILFKTRCQNDVNPRTADGFLYKFMDEAIILDYGYGPAIWYACSK